MADALDHAQTIPQQFVSLPAEVLLATIGYCALATLVALAAWARLSARHSRVVRKATDLEREHAELKARYDAEVKWRTASEAAQASTPPEPITAAPPTDTHVREKVTAILDGLISEGVIMSYRTNFQAVSIVTTGVVTDRSKPTAYRQGGQRHDPFSTTCPRQSCCLAGQVNALARSLPTSWPSWTLSLQTRESLAGVAEVEVPRPLTRRKYLQATCLGRGRLRHGRPTRDAAQTVARSIQ